MKGYGASNQPRALLALLAPIVGWSIVLIRYASLGYYPTDYLIFIMNGTIDVVPQVIGWICTAAWIWFYWPPAYAALRTPFLILDEGDRLLLSGGQKLDKGKIRNVIYRYRFFTKEVDFIEKTGFCATQNINFTSDDVSKIINEIMEDLRKHSGDTFAN